MTLPRLHQADDPQNTYNVSLLTFFHPVLDKLNEGKVIRNSIAIVLQVLGVLYVLGGIYLVVEILKSAFRDESTGTTIGGLLLVVFIAANVLAVQQICSYRARSVRELGDSPFTVIPIFSILMRTVGEILAVTWVALGLGGCLLLWLGGGYLLGLLPLTGLSRVLGFGYGEGNFLAGVAFLFTNSALAFIVLILFYFLAEAVVIGVDIARNVRVLVLKGGVAPGAMAAEGSAASSLPFPVIPAKAQRARIDFSQFLAPILSWFAANKLLAGGIAGAAVLLFAVYKLFLQADPVKDGKRVAEAYCDCNKANSQRLLDAEKGLLARVDAGRFKIRTVAQSELRSIESDLSQFNECNDEAAALYDKKISNYARNQEAMYEFQSALNQQGLCTDENATELNDVRAQLAAKIRSLPMYAGEEIPPTSTTEQIPVSPSSVSAFITGDGVRFRAEPSLNGAIMYRFAKGTQVEVLEWLRAG